MKTVVGLCIGLIISLIFTSFAGENPLHVLNIIIHSAFGSGYDIGLTLFYTTTFIFTGLSVCLAFHVGLFNIGAEGQLNIGAFAMAATGILFPNIPAILAPIVAILFGTIAASIWGFIPGYLKVKKGSHEVIVTMMMNFIAAAFIQYFTIGIFKNQGSQNPETQPLPVQFLIKGFTPQSPFNISFFIAVVICILVWFLLYKTIWGFQIRAIGQNQTTADFSGIQSKKIKILVMMAAAALAGLVGINEVIASAGKYRIGFSADYGFIGIAVALLARNNPLFIILSALLFGILQKGAADLDFETQAITRNFVQIIQAIIILSVIAVTKLNLKSLIKNVRERF